MKVENKQTEIKIPAEVFSRVSGYFQPVKQWKKGKQEELMDRAYLRVSILK